VGQIATERFPILPQLVHFGVGLPVTPLAKQLEALPVFIRDTTRVPMGTYSGLQFGLLLHPKFAPDVYLEGATIRHTGLSREHRGPRAVLNALERLAGGYGPEGTGTRQELSIAESQLRDYQARLGKPFSHEAYLSEMTGLRDQLKAGLSATHQADESGPTVSELAGRIKTLKSTNTIDATPQRMQRKHATAEEPVTARIRRRQEAMPTADESAQHDEAQAEAAAATPEPNSSARTMTFRERILRERGQTDELAPE
jgi:hypothetical protein